MDSITAIKHHIFGEPKKIIITMHVNPDADALGSSLALCAFLKKNHHSVKVISPTSYPVFLDWLPGISEIITYDKPDQQPMARQLIAESDIIFCVDFSAMHRADKLAEPIQQAAAKKIVIDHHLDVELFADILFSKPTAAASAELIYELMLVYQKRELIDKNIATCLYVGILTDTGSFKNPNTTSHVHRVVADLIEMGVDIEKVNRLVYENNSLNRTKFLGYILSNRLTVLEEYQTAYLTIKASDVKMFNLQTGDTEGLVNYALSIKGIFLAALFKEKQDGIYISFRSNGNYVVNTFANQHFQGGGHKNAAGGISRLSLEETITKFENLIKIKQLTLRYEPLKK